MEKNRKKALVIIEKEIREQQEKLMRLLEIKASAEFKLLDIDRNTDKSSLIYKYQNILTTTQAEKTEKNNLEKTVQESDKRIRDTERILLSLNNMKKAVAAGEKRARMYLNENG